MKWAGQRAITVPVTAREISQIRHKRWYFLVRVETGHSVHLRLTHTSAVEFVTHSTGLWVRMLMERHDAETEVYLRLG